MSSDGRLRGWTGSEWVPLKLDSSGRLYIDQPVGGGGGATAWLASVTAGIAQTFRFNMGSLFTHTAGVALDATRNALRIAQTPGLSLVASASGSVLAAQAPAFVTGARISDFKLPQTPAFEMQQVVYTLTRLVGGNAQAAVGTAWTNPGNAINGTDGVHNASSATCVGTLGGNTNGIELNYLNSASKGELVISSATLNVYMSVVDPTGLLCDTNLSYNIGGGLVALEPTIQGAFTNIVTPRSYVLPITTWAEYDALAARVVCIFSAASALANASLDAIEIVIVASKSDTL